MKKILFLLLTGLTVSVSNSQDVSDAVRFSQDGLNGTARFRAMSGAFGAVGGDLSALSVNPAGSAIFLNNQMGVSFSNQNIKNNASYFNTDNDAKENSFILNQAGGVFVFNDYNPDNNWKKIAIGINFENTNDFDNRIISFGKNPTNSIDRYFLAYANGVPLNVINGMSYSNMFYNEQQAYFGVRGNVILPVSNAGTNSDYISNVPAAGGGYYHENEVYTSGYSSKVSFNIATSFKDRLFLGANLNAHILDYRRVSSFYEDNESPLLPNHTVSSLRFNNELYTYGNGFSFQLGAIAKITDGLRLGLAYESNTWYELYDEVTQSLYSTTENNSNEAIDYSVNPNIINTYEVYTLQTPGKFTISGAYVFGKSGLISIDYSIKDYANAKFKPTNDPDFRDTNSQINNQLTSSGELRIGGEYRINQLKLRAGYRFEGSPYQNGTTVGDLNSYSAGLGYNFGGTKVDLAYVYAQRKSYNPFFNVGFTDGADVTSKMNNVSLTLLFEL